MQERYLFRGKRIDNGEWVIGNCIDDGVTGQVFIHTVGNSVNESDKVGEEGCLQFVAFEVAPSTICQCTGLKDKNGNLIWENDIVACKHEKYIGTDVLDSKMHKYTRNYAIEFENTFCNYGLRFRNKSIHFRCKQATLCMHDCEVLGNVFDNPELLKE